MKKAKYFQALALQDNDVKLTEVALLAREDKSDPLAQLICVALKTSHGNVKACWYRDSKDGEPFIRVERS